MTVQRNDWSLQRKGIIDQERHKERVRDAIKKNLGSIVSNESIILSDGKKTVKVPMRSLDEYKFRFDPRKKKQVGQGDGNSKVGDVIAREGNQQGQGQGKGQAGSGGGQDYYEAEVNIDELAALIFEDLQLPYMQEKAKKEMPSKTTKFTEIRRSGVMSNLDKRRSILENIRRNAKEAGAAKIGNFKKEDLRFKTWEEDIRHESNAVVIAMMDVSGCATEGHLIEMADGSYKDISKMEIGDQVACIDLKNHKKTTSSVTMTYKKTTDRTYLIETQDAKLRTTAEHKFFVYDEANNQILEKQASEIKVEDKLILVNSWGTTSLNNSTLSKEQAYLIGVLLGDGYLKIPTKQGSYGTYLTITDQNIDRLKVYQELFQIAFNKASKINLKRNENTRQHLQVSSSSLVRELEQIYPMLKKRSPQRYIEKSIYLESPEIRAAFLQGLFDAEGTLSHHSVMLYSSSYTLVKQVKQLLSYWGIRARINGFWQSSDRIKEEFVKEGIYYSLSINSKDAITFQENIGFRCKEKAEKLSNLVAKQEQAINAMRSKYIMPFMWREKFGHLAKTKRVYGYYKSNLEALSYSQLQSIASDPKASLEDILAIDNVLKNQFIVSKIKTITPCDEIISVYDFEVANHHNYIMDGILSHNSMGEFKKYIARSFYFWMVRFLKTKYDNVKIIFISHHTEAKEVTEEQFFTQGESGGTVVSSAYKLALSIIKERFPATDWNIYPFHFSDGDNYYSDNDEAVKLADELIKTCNLFGYGEIGEEGASSYRRSSGALLSLYKDHLKNKDRFIGVRIDDKEDVYPALKEFFGKRGEKV